MQTIDPSSLLFDSDASPMDRAPAQICPLKGSISTPRLPHTVSTRIRGSADKLQWEYFDSSSWQCFSNELELEVVEDPTGGTCELELENKTDGLIRVTVKGFEEVEIEPNGCHKWPCRYDSSASSAWDITGSYESTTEPSPKLRRLPDPTFKVIKAGG